MSGDGVGGSYSIGEHPRLALVLVLDLHEASVVDNLHLGNFTSQDFVFFSAVFAWIRRLRKSLRYLLGYFTRKHDILRKSSRFSARLRQKPRGKTSNSWLAKLPTPNLPTNIVPTNIV